MTGLEVAGLTVDLPGRPRVLDGVDLSVRPGQVVALVGPSGTGKSLTVRAIARLLPPGAESRESVRLGDVDLLTLDRARLRAVRGAVLGCVFQNPTASLNPTLTIGRHLAETIRAHRRRPRATRERPASGVRIVDDVTVLDDRGARRGPCRAGPVRAG